MKPILSGAGWAISEQPDKRLIIIHKSANTVHLVQSRTTREGRILGTTVLNDNVHAWINENLSPSTKMEDNYLYGGMHITFASDRDYVLFKMFWL